MPDAPLAYGGTIQNTAMDHVVCKDWYVQE